MSEKQRKHDECLRACASRVLSVDYDETPAISASGASTEAFWGAWVNWAERRGYRMFFYYDGMPPQREWIAAAPSLNSEGRDHAVVMRRSRLAFDPVSNGWAYSRLSPTEAKYGIAFEPLSEPTP